MATQEKASKKSYAERVAEQLRKQATAAVARAEATRRRSAIFEAGADATGEADDATWALDRATKMRERADRQEAERSPFTKATPQSVQAMLDVIKASE